MHFSLLFLLGGLYVKEKIVQGIKEYKQLNLRWNIEGMMYINSKGILIRDLFNEEKYVEALIVILTAGTENKDIHYVKTFLNKFLVKYNELESLRFMVLLDLKEKHKFLVDKTEDDEPINELLANKKEEPTEIDRDKELRENEESYKYILFSYMKAGYKIEEALKMDMNTFELINEYNLRNREDNLNGLMLLAHRCGMLSGVGFHNMKKYPDKPENIRLRPMSKAERIEKLKADAEKFRMETIAELEKR